VSVREKNCQFRSRQSWGLKKTDRKSLGRYGGSFDDKEGVRTYRSPRRRGLRRRDPDRHTYNPPNRKEQNEKSFAAHASGREESKKELTMGGGGESGPLRDLGRKREE